MSKDKKKAGVKDKDGKAAKVKTAKVKTAKVKAAKAKSDKTKSGKKKPAKAPKPAAAKPAISPLAPAQFPSLPPIDGVEFATAAAGVKYQGRTDLMLARLAPGTSLAGVFTRSSTRAASVLDCQRKLDGSPDSDEAAAIIVNSGNANAFTGQMGDEAVDAVTAAVAEALEIPQSRVLSSSTGVIGEPLPTGRITEAIPDLAAALRPDAAEAAARAIMTTDTFPKGATATVETESGPIRIAGIAKGSGMIAPDMATMLVYLFTDAKISATLARELLVKHVRGSFNAITVDSDTSTSDALIMAATGRGPAPAVTDLRERHARAFSVALHEVMTDLAHQVVRDGEGATKFVEIAVTGAPTGGDANRVARAVANSPLVKTAIAGEDANWGRVVAAIGKSGARVERDRLSIRFGDIVVAENGWRAPDYDEAEVSRYMKGDRITIGIDLGLGKGLRTMWTCDLTHGYIDINADYRS